MTDLGFKSKGSLFFLFEVVYLFFSGSSGSLLLRVSFLKFSEWGLLSSCGAQTFHVVTSLIAEHAL